MQIVTVEPGKELKAIVKMFWYAVGQEQRNTHTTYNILADGAPGIIFQHNNGRSALINHTGEYLPVSFVYGQSTNPCINHITGHPFVFGVSLQPAALKKIFSSDAAELTNALADTEHFFSKAFNERILNTANPEDIIQLFNEQLYQKLVKSKHDNMIDESINLIMQRTKAINSDMLAKCFHLSRRQFQRKFKEHIGVCPETYTRIIKFQRSIQLLRTRRYEKLSDIGYMLDYADQSHFGREFSSFSGYTPSAFLKTATMQQSFQRNNPSPFETLRIIEN